MAQNYTRQSSFADGDTITAALFNNEFNQVVNAFAYSASSDGSTGHKHDGTSGQGGNIPQIGDIDFLNKIVVDNTNNRWGFYVQVSGGTVEQLRIQDGAIVPVTNNDIDLGTSSLEFKDLFLDGTAHIDTLDVDVNATVAGTLGVTGASTLTGNVTATNDLSVGGNLTVTGNATIAGNLTFGDAATDTVAFSADVASNLLPSVDNTYDLGAAGSEWKDLYIDGTANIDSLVADTADINGGTVDGVTIGGSSAGDITYANLSDGTIIITAFADEDDMVSNSATLVPTQQSVKAYVDAQVTAQDLDIVGDTGTDAIDLDSETITFAGGTGITSVVTTGTVTHNIDSTVATLTGSQTLTNKSLTAPTLTGTAIVASLDISGDIDVDGTTNLDVVDIDGAVDFGSTTAHAGNATFADNAKAIFGAGSDLQIYHDGANSYIQNVTNSLIIQNDSDDKQVIIKSDNGSGGVADYFRANGTTGEALLYHYGSSKLATTATGIDVTGSVVATQAEVGSGTDGVKLTYSAGNSTGIVDTGFTSTGIEIRTGNVQRMFVNSTGIDVTGSVTADGLTVDASTASMITLNHSTPSNLTTIGQDSSGDFRVRSDNVNKLKSYANGDFELYEDTGTTPKFFWDASAEALGIGTTDPATYGGLTLQQSSNTSSKGLAIVDSTAAQSVKLWVDGTNSYLSSGNTGADPLVLNLGGGNVGIGTSSPQKLLDITENSSGESIPVVIANRDVTAGTGQKVTLGFGLSRNSGAFKPEAGTIEVGRESDWTASDANIDSYMAFSTYLNNAATEKMRIDASGNVGIGETSPSTYGKLVVTGSTPFAVLRSSDVTTAGFSMLVNSGSNGVGSIATDNGGHMTFDTGSTGASQAERMRIDASGNLIMTAGGSIVAGGANDLILNAGESGTPDIYLQSGGSTKVKVEGSNGNVGIGNPSPTDKLHLGTSSGATQLKIQSGSGINNCILHTNGTTDSWRTGMNLSLTDGSYEFYDDVNNLSRMIIDASGNVGIGTSSPDTLAHLAAGAGSAVLRLENTDAFLSDGEVVGKIEFETQDAGGAGVNAYIQGVGVSTNGATKLEFGTGGSNSPETRMTINSNGNVGIGESSPTFDVQIRRAAEVNLGLSYTGQTTSELAAEASAVTALKSSGSLRFVTNTSTEAMRIDASGNLLVSDTAANPSGDNVDSGIALHNAGLVRASTNNAAAPLDLNVKGRNGDIAVFRKDGTSVGSIGYGAGVLGIGQGTGNLGLFDATVIPMGSTSGAASDGVISLGGSNSRRFKDLYLSGGVVFGDAGGSGTSSSNTLDSYEEGTWTPTVSSGVTSPAYTNQSGSYTKVGNLVYFQFRVDLSSGTASASQQFTFGGLPFTSQSAANYGGAWISYSNGFLDDLGTASWHVGPNNTEVFAYKPSDGAVMLGTEIDAIGDVLGNVYLNGVYRVA